MDYDVEDTLLDESACNYDLIGDKIALYRGGVRVSGALFLVTMLHTCIHTKGSTEESRGGEMDSTTRGSADQREHDENTEEPAQCSWCRDKACRVSDQELAIVAVDMGMGVLDLEIDALVSETGAEARRTSTETDLGESGVDGTLGVSLEARMAALRENGMMCELQCVIPPGEARSALLESVDSGSPGDTAALLTQLLHVKSSHSSKSSGVGIDTAVGGGTNGGHGIVLKVRADARGGRRHVL